MRPTADHHTAAARFDMHATLTGAVFKRERLTAGMYQQGRSNRCGHNELPRVKETENPDVHFLCYGKRTQQQYAYYGAWFLHRTDSLLDATEHLTSDLGRIGARGLVRTNHEQNLRSIGRHHCNYKTITQCSWQVRTWRSASFCQGVRVLECVVDFCSSSLPGGFGHSDQHFPHPGLISMVDELNISRSHMQR